MLTGIRGSGKTVMLTDISEIYRSKDEWIVVDLNPNANMTESLLAKLGNEGKVIDILKNAKLNLSFFGIGLEFSGGSKITHVEIS